MHNFQETSYEAFLRQLEDHNWELPYVHEGNTTSYSNDFDVAGQSVLGAGVEAQGHLVPNFGAMVSGNDPFPNFTPLFPFDGVVNNQNENLFSRLDFQAQTGYIPFRNEIIVQKSQPLMDYTSIFDSITFSDETHATNMQEPDVGSAMLLRRCAVSTPSFQCPCEFYSLQDFLALKYKPNPESKPTRAMKTGICHRLLLERFPIHHRQDILLTLLDPVRHLPKLKNLVRRYNDDGNKFGCPCCPRARFQTSAKVEQHLRGQLGIRLFTCQHCNECKISEDDKKKHERTCRSNPWKSPSPSQ